MGRCHSLLEGIQVLELIWYLLTYCRQGTPGPKGLHTSFGASIHITSGDVGTHAASEKTCTWYLLVPIVPDTV
jgi:hypothetical protein